MTDEELIKTLWSGEVTLGVVASAATRIEHLLEGNKGLAEAFATVSVKREMAEAKLAECLEQNALLEARLGKAVEALRIAIDVMWWVNGIDAAEAVLAELEKTE